MRKSVRMRPSAALVVSIVALVAALGGTAYAGFAVPKNSVGTKQLKNKAVTSSKIKNKAVTSSKIKNGSVTSSKINTSGLTVPNANALGGQAPSAYLTTANRIGTNGVVKSAGSSTGVNTTLFKVGPFTVTMACTDDGTNTSLTVTATSTEAGSDLNGTLVPTANTPQDLGGNVDIDPTPDGTFSSDDDVNIDFEAPSGAEAVLVGATGVSSLGTTCWSNFAGIH